MHSERVVEQVHPPTEIRSKVKSADFAVVRRSHGRSGKDATDAREFTELQGFHGYFQRSPGSERCTPDVVIFRGKYGVSEAGEMV